MYRSNSFEDVASEEDIVYSSPIMSGISIWDCVFPINVTGCQSLFVLTQLRPTEEVFDFLAAIGAEPIFDSEEHAKATTPVYIHFSDIESWTILTEEQHEVIRAAILWS